MLTVLKMGLGLAIFVANVWIALSLIQRQDWVLLTWFLIWGVGLRSELDTLRQRSRHHAQGRALEDHPQR